MSFQAVAWAMKQELPVIPKFILVALCERANPDTGECWPGIETVAKAVCLSERSVVTYIAALVRNGYVMRQAMRGKDGRHRTNHYWIMFDREPAAWISPNDEPDANLARGGETELHTQTDSSGPDATGFPRHIEPEPPRLEPPESEQEDRRAAPPSSFEPNKRVSELNRLKAAEEARKPKRIAVIEGSRPWDAHVKAGHPPSRVVTVEVNGKHYRGYYFPTLYPQPKATGPPLPLGFMTSEDESAI